MERKSGWIGRLIVSSMLAAAIASPALAGTPDYMNDAFEYERLLDWGTRPDWSPDGRRIVFTEAEFHDTFAYELDVETREVRCLTCWLGMNGVVTRIYYLPDGSFLILAPVNLASPDMRKRTSRATDHINQELYWMPASGEVAPQPLGARAFGEIAISGNPTNDAVQIAWGSVVDGKRLITTANLARTSDGAGLEDVRTVFDSSVAGDVPISVTETYGFSNADRTVYFWTIDSSGSMPVGEMYEIDIASGDLRTMYETPWHNETHLLPGGDYGLEESNRASDPAGAWRGVSSLDGSVVAGMAAHRGAPMTAEEIEQYAPYQGVTGFDRPFDLFVVSMETPSRIRQLTDVSRFGANATQSASSPDGRYVAFAIDGRSSEEYGDAGGLYLGEFISAD